MARENNSGVIRPYKKTSKHTLKNSKTRTYTSYEARIDMGEDEYGKRMRKTVSAKTYKACMTKINAILKDKNEWGMSVSKTVSLGPYAEDWLAVKKTTCDPSTYRGYMTCVRRTSRPTPTNRSGISRRRYVAESSIRCSPTISKASQ